MISGSLLQTGNPFHKCFKGIQKQTVPITWCSDFLFDLRNHLTLDHVTLGIVVPMKTAL